MHKWMCKWLFFKFHVRFYWLSFNFRYLTHFLLSADFFRSLRNLSEFCFPRRFHWRNWAESYGIGDRIWEICRRLRNLAGGRKFELGEGGCIDGGGRIFLTWKGKKGRLKETELILSWCKSSFWGKVRRSLIFIRNEWLNRQIKFWVRYHK